MPPQGARALIRGLFRRDPGGPVVACVLFEPHPGANELDFTNEGSEPAVGLRYVVARADGSLGRGDIGSLSPGGEVTVPIGAVEEPLRSVWICADRRRRTHIWSYDGKHKRFGKNRSPDDRDCFTAMYQD
jgi:hypothetical protein